MISVVMALRTIKEWYQISIFRSLTIIIKRSFMVKPESGILNTAIKKFIVLEQPYFVSREDDEIWDIYEG